MKKLMLIVLTVASTSGTMANAEPGKWFRVQAASVTCDYLQVRIGSIFAAQYVRFQMERHLELSFQCNLAVAQALQEGKAIMINNAGEVVPEDGSFVRQGN